jgi:hypothetical protein
MNDQLATEARAAMVDALIVAALYRDQPVGAMVRLTVTEPGLARGRFLPFYGAFMPTRRRTTADIATARRAAQDGAGTRRVSSLPALTLGLAREPWEFYTALALGDLRHIGVVPDEGGGLEHWLVAPDGSWAFQQIDSDGQPIIREGGRRMLWTELEEGYRRWEAWGKPERDRFGLTVWADRRLTTAAARAAAGSARDARGRPAPSAAPRGRPHRCRRAPEAKQDAGGPRDQVRTVAGGLAELLDRRVALLASETVPVARSDAVEAAEDPVLRGAHARRVERTFDDRQGGRRAIQRWSPRRNRAPCAAP